MSTNTIWLTIVNNTSNDLEEKTWRASLPRWICWSGWSLCERKAALCLWQSLNEGKNNNFLFRASSLERRLSWSGGEAAKCRCRWECSTQEPSAPYKTLPRCSKFYTIGFDVRQILNKKLSFLDLSDWCQPMLFPGCFRTDDADPPGFCDVAICNFNANLTKPCKLRVVRQFELIIATLINHSHCLDLASGFTLKQSIMFQHSQPFALTDKNLR